MENNKMYEAIQELNTKGSIQEQAKELVELEKLYKKLLTETESNIWKNKLDNIRLEMCMLSDKVQENMKTFDELIKIKAMDIQIFLDTFTMDTEEYDNKENCYFNLSGSMTDIGHCIRMALIHAEKLLKEMMEEESFEEDNIDV